MNKTRRQAAASALTLTLTALWASSMPAPWPAMAREKPTGKSSGQQNTVFSANGVFIPQPLATPARTLKFPGNVSYGGLIVCDQPLFIIHNTESNAPTCKAQGTIQIPANKFVVFAPNFNYINNPHVLDSLPANAFDGIILRFIAMEDKDEGKGDIALAALNHFTSLRSLDLQKAEITDAGLSKLKDLKNLEAIELFNTSVNGTFLKDLTGSKKLRALLISYNALDLNCLKYLPQFPLLAKLDLGRTRLTVPAIKPLQQCPNLQILDISDNSNIDDSVVELLLSMKHLKTLRAKKTALSSKGIDRLSKAGLRPQDVFWEAQVEAAEAAAARRRAGGKTEKQDAVEEIFSPVSRGRGL